MAGCPIVTCDPLEPTAKCSSSQGCYYSSVNYDYECLAAGSGNPGTACKSDPDCKPTNGCNPDETGIVTKCTPYCAHAPTSPDGGVAVSTCPSGESCQNIDGTNGYCAKPPALSCDLLDQSSCTGTNQGCYPAVNGATNCLPAGKLPVGDTNCSVDTDCVPGAICSLTDYYSSTVACVAMCNPTGTPSGCPNVTDTCAPAPGQSGFALCWPCDSASVCGSGATAVCCANGTACDTTKTPPSCTAAAPCSPLDATPCTNTADGCYFDMNQLAFFCALPTGSGHSGAPCKVDSECLPGEGCNGGSFDACAPYCDLAATTDPCPKLLAGTTCKDSLTVTGVGACK